MKCKDLMIGVFIYIVTGSITLAIIQTLGKGSPELAFVMGAILVSQVMGMLIYKSEKRLVTIKEKSSIGTMLLILCGVFGITVQILYKVFVFPDISIGTGMIGSFIFPFVISNTALKAMIKSKNEKG